MQIQKTNVNFTGVRFPHDTNMRDLEKIRQFLANDNNIKFIKKLNARETDIYFSEGIEKIGFAHQRYGELNKYGASDIAASDFAKNEENTLKTITKAIRKVQDAWRNIKEYHRGC